MRSLYLLAASQIRLSCIGSREDFARKHVAPTASGLEKVQNSTDDATIVDARLTRLAARQMSINRGPCFVG
jgi:hypothetical protein